MGPQSARAWLDHAQLLNRIDFTSARYIAELGPGTGVFTEAILERLHPEGKLLAIDTNAGFVEHLKREYPDVYRLFTQFYRQDPTARIAARE